MAVELDSRFEVRSTGSFSIIQLKSAPKPKVVAAAAPKAAATKPVETKAAAPAPKKEEKKVEAPKKDDVDDLFGDDDDEEEETVLDEFRQKAKDAALARAAKKEAVAKSQIVFDIKGWGEETNLEDLALRIKALVIPGLVWGEGHQLVPLAFGISKLQVSCVIPDTLLTDDITDKLEAEFGDDGTNEIQSIDVFAFNKL